MGSKDQRHKEDDAGGFLQALDPDLPAPRPPGPSLKSHWSPFPSVHSGRSGEWEGGTLQSGLLPDSPECFCLET